MMARLIFFGVYGYKGIGGAKNSQNFYCAESFSIVGLC